MAEGFIKLNRKLLEWEWYSDANTMRLFLHCLLKANWKDGRFRGTDVPRGSFITSLQSLSDELGISIKSVRTALEHLQGTGEVASKSFPHYRMITVVKYNEYQDEGKLNGKQRASKGQANGKQVATIEEYKKEKEFIKKGKNEPNPQLKKIEELYMKEIMNDQLRDSL